MLLLHRWVVIVELGQVERPLQKKVMGGPFSTFFKLVSRIQKSGNLSLTLMNKSESYMFLGELFVGTKTALAKFLPYTWTA